MSEEIKIKRAYLAVMFGLAVHLGGSLFLFGRMAERLEEVHKEVLKRANWVYIVPAIQKDMDGLKERVRHLERQSNGMTQR